MASVLGYKDEEIQLRDCACGSEPEYLSANGLLHVIVCPNCGATTDKERTGYDAVHAWNKPDLQKSA